MAKTTRLLLAAFLAAGYNGPAQAGPPSGLSVATVPAGAAVYVDGQLKGSAPLSLVELPAGDHRVTVAMEGYLENSRVVSLQPGRPQAVQVKLTPDAGQTRHALQVEEGNKKSGGGGGKKGLWIGLGVVAAGAGAYLALRSTNKAPIPGTISVTPDNVPGLMAVTTFTFTSSASDPDGDPLTYNWNLGDGGTGSGATVTHVYNNTGSFQVTLSVSDGKKTATAPGRSVTVKSLTGTWSGTLRGSSFSIPTTINFTQSGTSLSGGYSDPDGPGSVSGQVSDPRSVRFTVNQPPFNPWVFTGTADDQLNNLNGVANGSGFVSAPWTLARR